MGQDVESRRFGQQDYLRFGERLRDEMALLNGWIERDRLSHAEPTAGLELEAWLVDERGLPAPRNAELIERLACPEVVTELGRFHIELNVPPQPVRGDGLARLGESLAALWSRCRAVAAPMGLRVLATGILPTLRDDDLTLARMSDRARYRTLNREVQRQRHGRPVQLDIDGPHGEHLRSEHPDVMLEAGTTSFQVHLQVPADAAVRHYNAALIAAAPLLALAVNSPLLFGRRLWAETRVPLFEQALGVGTREDGMRPPLSRVGFGSGYAGWSMGECFRENLERFEPLLPALLDEPAERLPHLRLHNGTIWRWNRPLVGFDTDGTPHLRIEHRALPAGPSLPDMMAQLALTIGLVGALAREAEPPEARLSFADAKGNFYAAARDGLDATLVWTDGAEHRARDLLAPLLLQARAGLRGFGAATPVIDRWFESLAQRRARGLTGARWQLHTLDALGGDLPALTCAIADHQSTGLPLHRWR